MPEGRWIFITEDTRDAIDALPYSDLLYGLVEAYDAMPEQHVRDFPAKPGFNRRHIDIVITFPDAPSEHTCCTCPEWIKATGSHHFSCPEAPGQDAHTAAWHAKHTPFREPYSGHTADCSLGAHHTGPCEPSEHTHEETT